MPGRAAGTASIHFRKHRTDAQDMCGGNERQSAGKVVWDVTVKPQRPMFCTQAYFGRVPPMVENP